MVIQYFIDYTSFKVIVKYWLYSLCCTIYLCRASLVAQWLRVCLPVRRTRVRALVWEDPACRGATRPVSHNY